MSEFDVRKDSDQVDSIRVSGSDGTFSICELIERDVRDYVFIYDCADDVDDGLRVKDREHAENLILGLKKAIALGWL